MKIVLNASEVKTAIAAYIKVQQGCEISIDDISFVKPRKGCDDVAEVDLNEIEVPTGKIHRAVKVS